MAELQKELATAFGEIDLLEVMLEDVTTRIDLLCHRLETRFSGKPVAYQYHYKPNMEPEQVVASLIAVFLLNGVVEARGFEVTQSKGGFKVTKKRRRFTFNQIIGIYDTYEEAFKQRA